MTPADTGLRLSGAAVKAQGHLCLLDTPHTKVGGGLKTGARLKGRLAFGPVAGAL
ncbi:hypothetical protein [Kamptonema formosum]|uniref:hypothetical protein n=1 Tax=Kamptonema formosum TaxID=331992 RepID=UPI000347CFED|nr:hypothetical protein [Oscillatoria sp. PCC 10802]